MKTAIVLISAEHFSNSRKVCESIEKQVFTNSSELREKINAELETDHTIEQRNLLRNSILIYEISDFMDAVNNQELDVLTNHFLSYVQLK